MSNENSEDVIGSGSFHCSTDDGKPRAITADELRDMLLDQMRVNAEYWATVDVPGGPTTTKQRIDGALFSTLSMLDGCTLGLPAFDLVAKPHKDDKQYHIYEGENWIEDETRISDAIHEHWHKK